jgi:hypothetical protein
VHTLRQKRRGRFRSPKAPPISLMAMRENCFPQRDRKGVMDIFRQRQSDFAQQGSSFPFLPRTNAAIFVPQIFPNTSAPSHSVNHESHS